MVTRIVHLFVLALISISTFAQERIKIVGIETGINFIESEMIDNDRIRAARSDYDGYYDGGPLHSTMSRVYAGVKGELRSSNNFFAYATGIRFSRISSVLSNPSDEFYYLFRQSETATEYLKIKEINQITNYLSVPLEVRVFPYRERSFRLYFLAGTEMGCRIASKHEVEFSNPAMDQHESDVSETIKKPDSFYASVYTRAGFIIGGDKPILEAGITLPFLITRSVSTLGDVGVGGGFHLQLLRKF